MMEEMDEGLPDQTLSCVDCGVEFTFTGRDQAFYKERGFQPPRRCKTCRDKRKSGAPGSSSRPTPAGGSPSPRFGGGGGGGGYGHGGGGYGHGGGGGQGGAEDQRDHFKVMCSGCGVETTVPFKPDPNRPVFCRSCYLSRKKA
jgi:CxxC-x17-CxxC domain-containing protein